jgi:hypothetical protein
MKKSEIKISDKSTSLEIKIVNLTKNNDFKVLLVVVKDTRNYKKLIQLSLLYKDIFFTKIYAEARYYIESFKIFADQKYADLDTSDFEVKSKKDENGRTNHTFFCRFIKKEKVYLSRAIAKTIASVFLESTYVYTKRNLLEDNILEFPLYFANQKDLPKRIENLLDNKIKDFQDANIPVELKNQLSLILSNFYMKK